MRIKHDNTKLLAFASTRTHIGVFAKDSPLRNTYLFGSLERN